MSPVWQLPVVHNVFLTVWKGICFFFVFFSFTYFAMWTHYKLVCTQNTKVFSSGAQCDFTILPLLGRQGGRGLWILLNVFVWINMMMQVLCHSRITCSVFKTRKILNGTIKWIVCGGKLPYLWSRGHQCQRVRCENAAVFVAEKHKQTQSDRVTLRVMLGEERQRP